MFFEKLLHWFFKRFLSTHLEIIVIVLIVITYATPIIYARSRNVSINHSYYTTHEVESREPSFHPHLFSWQDGFSVKSVRVTLMYALANLKA